MWVLYTFWMLSPDPHLWFTENFSHLVGCLFMLLRVSFALQKQSYLLIFAFAGCASHVISTKCIVKTNVKVLLPYVFFYEVYGISFCLSVWPFRVNFCEWCKMGFQFHCFCFHKLSMFIDLSQHQLLKRQPFCHWAWLPCRILVDCKCGGLIVVSVSCSVGLCLFVSF